MKNSKKFLTLILALALALSCMFVFASCSDTKSDTLKIGIIQYMEHPSLKNCYDGIIAGLNASGLKYTVDYQVGSANSADSDCVNFANTMVANKVDMIFAIATPAAKSAVTAAADSKIPVIFCAVSDPIAAGLCESQEKPGSNTTGTSDVLDLAAQVNLIQSLQPSVKKIGILYTSSEENSLTNLKNFKEICAARNLEVYAVAVQSPSDIPSAAEDVASKVDCINNFTDNNVVNQLPVVLEAASRYNIPVYGSEEEQVKNGCLASVSIDYVALGKVTAEIGVKVLNGAKCATTPFQTISDATPVVNHSVLDKFGFTVPSSYTNIQYVGE